MFSHGCNRSGIEAQVRGWSAGYEDGLDGLKNHTILSANEFSTRPLASCIVAWLLKAAYALE